MATPELDFREDEDWQWQDTRLIQLERSDDELRPHEIGCIDVFASQSGDLAGSYIPIERFADPDAAAAFSQQLDTQFAQTNTIPYQMDYFAERAALKHADGEVTWRSAGPAEYDAFIAQSAPQLDAPPHETLDPLLATAYELGGVPGRTVPIDTGTFQAVEQLGVSADTLRDDASRPLYDAASDTHYWIGVFQPDPADTDFCITSILSVQRDPATQQPVAHLAPCADGDWDTAYEHATNLIDVAHQQGLDACLDVAADMARDTQQHLIWDDGHGVQLDESTSRHVADQLELDR